jgi:hypothetical protein
MNTRQARETARDWVAENLTKWPGLRAAHLTGGITTMPDDAPFPPHKDVDLHLIFDEGSPALTAGGPFQNIIETEFRGLMIEAGLKPVTLYARPEDVLSNPEIAHHLTRDSVLYDPDGLLRALEAPVRREFARSRWVRARVASEREGLCGALARTPEARSAWGASGEINLLGYSFTFAGAAIAVAGLKPPSIGGRFFVKLRGLLAEQGRLDLHEQALTALGVGAMAPEAVERWLRRGTEVFDRAVPVYRTPHPFGHKLHAYLRPYFVDSCRSMLDEGFHREAMCWIIAYVCSATDVLRADGPEARRAESAALCDALLRDLGLDRPEARAEAFARAARVHDACFALAGEIIARHPCVTD